MKIVIDIPADDFNAIYHGGLYAIQHDKLDQVITEAFQTAIIIPKGHGDLIDRDALKTKLPTPIEDEYKTVYKIVDSMPSVIDADT
jgi:hypothetical protein